MPVRAHRLAIFILTLALSVPLFARDAATISSVSPGTIHANSGEWFIQVHGTKFLPANGVQVVFTGPAGTVALAPNKATDSVLDVWLPSEVIQRAGTYSIVVQVPNGPASNARGFVVVGSIWIKVPNFALIEAIHANGAPVKFDVTATSALGEQTYVDCSHRSGETYGFGLTEVDCIAYDDYDNSDKASFSFEVGDTRPPVLSLPRELRVFGKPEGTDVSFEAAAEDAVDGKSEVSCEPRSGSFFRIGTTIVNCTSSDRRENVAKESFRVHVGDEETPALVVPPGVTAEATSREGANVEFEATATDAKGNPATEVRCDPKAGSLFPIGTTSVKCTAWGPTGKSQTQVFDVQVADTSAPVLEVPRTITEQAPSAEGAKVTYFASAKDAVDGETQADCYPKSGSLFAPGTTTVTCSSTDSRRNEITLTFDVNVLPWVDETDYVKTGGDDERNQ